MFAAAIGAVADHDTVVDRAQAATASDAITSERAVREAGVTGRFSGGEERRERAARSAARRRKKATRKGDQEPGFAGMASSIFVIRSISVV
jgi:hypothetical protein